MTKADQVKALIDYLQGEGYRPETDKDGDIKFKIEGGTYYIILEEKDDLYIRLLYPNFWSIESSEERSKVERAALKATSTIKVAKVYPIQDNTMAAVELFSSSLDNSKAVFRRALSALKASVAAFQDEMRK